MGGKRHPCRRIYPALFRSRKTEMEFFWHVCVLSGWRNCKSAVKLLEEKSTWLSLPLPCSRPFWHTPAGERLQLHLCAAGQLWVQTAWRLIKNVGSSEYVDVGLKRTCQADCCRSLALGWGSGCFGVVWEGRTGKELMSSCWMMFIDALIRVSCSVREFVFASVH